MECKQFKTVGEIVKKYMLIKQYETSVMIVLKTTNTKSQK